MQDFKTALTMQLQQTLPGEVAHDLLMPETRKKDMPFTRLKPRKSAVMILIYPNEGHFNTITILRPQYDGIHSGQIAFPGGRFEKEDLDLMDTAIRETKEEIGVEVKKSQIIGQLTHVFIPPSNFDVSPYIAFLDEKPLMKENSYEVEKLVELNLDDIKKQDAITQKMIFVERYGNVMVPCFLGQGEIIWGATAMMLSELREILLRIPKS